jgi:phosphoserine phosphatase RsbU/P
MTTTGSVLSGEDPRRSEQIRRLTELSRALTYTTSLEDVLRLAVTRAAELLDARQAVVMLTDGDGLLHVRAAHGVEEERVRMFRQPLDESLIGRLQGLFDVEGDECFLGVPLVVQGEVTGLLAALRSSGEPCTDADEWLLSALADQAAVALENARLQAEVRREAGERARALRDVTEEKERALSMLAHDLRSPLSAIDSFAELMEMELLGPVTDRQREGLGRIRMSGRHLLAVLENVLEMARLSSGAERLRSRAVPLAEVMEEARQMVHHRAADKAQSLQVETASRLQVVADPDRLRQVLINLLGNAITYTPAGGSIRLEAFVAEKDGAAWGGVTVSDDGPGIPSELHEAIFQPYYRAAAGDSESGSGLGLAICRELVRQMDGYIEVASRVGYGSTFALGLPLAEGEGEGADSGDVGTRD